MNEVVAFPRIPFSPLGAKPVRTPVWRLVYAGKDVTREISPMIRAVTYTDHAHGESDEVQIELEDREGRWREGWYPAVGDQVEMWIGYEGEALLPCGRFAVDEFESTGPPDVMTIRALAAGPVPAFRTKRSAAYEGQTLQQIAEAVAARYSLSVVGQIRAIHVGRATQSEEHDMAFLARLAEQYGYVFSIRGDQLVFYEVAQLEAGAATWSITRAGVEGFRLQSATRSVYREVQVSYHDAGKKKLVSQSAKDESVKTGDTYKMRIRAEDAGQAEAIAKATLRKLNRKRTQGSIDLEGDPRMVAGTNGTLRGWGKFDGTYHVESSRHRMSRRDGYTTSVELVGLG